MIRRRSLLAVASALALVVAGEGTGAEAYYAKDSALRREITKVMAAPVVTAASAKVGVAVYDASNAGSIYLRNNTAALTPASTLKLFTAATGLALLGENHRWATEVWAQRAPVGGVVSGNLYLVGTGDPTLLDRDLVALAKSLRARGITRVTGAVVADPSAFDSQLWNPYWNKSYESEYYAAQVSALTLSPNTDYDAGTVIISNAPGKKVGDPIYLGVHPAAARTYTKVVNRATTGAVGTASTLTVQRLSGTNTIVLKGRVPLRRAVSNARVTINHPEMFAAHALKVHLAEVGIRVDRGVSRGVTPAGSSLQQRHQSMTLRELMVPFLKLSNNGHAEAITKTLGRRYGRPGNWAHGTAVIRAYTASLGGSMTGFRLVDGSGLARANTITTTHLATLLYRAQSKPWFAAWRSGLPKAGAAPVRWAGGTLASRMPGVGGRVHAKDGGLTGVSSLAGYARGADGRRYLFAMIGNYSGARTQPVEDRLGRLLAGWRMTNR